MTPDSSSVSLLHFLSLLLHLELLPTDMGFLLANGSALNRFPTVSSISQINKWIDASRHSTIDDYPIPRHPSMSWSEAIRCSISSISIENSSQAGTFARESFKLSVGLVHVSMHFASNSNPETTRVSGGH